MEKIFIVGNIMKMDFQQKGFKLKLAAIKKHIGAGILTDN